MKELNPPMPPDQCRTFKDAELQTLALNLNCENQWMIWCETVMVWGKSSTFMQQEAALTEQICSFCAYLTFDHHTTTSRWCDIMLLQEYEGVVM